MAKMSAFPATQVCPATSTALRCVWGFRHRAPGKDWRFPFKLAEKLPKSPRNVMCAHAPRHYHRLSQPEPAASFGKLWQALASFGKQEAPMALAYQAPGWLADALGLVG